MAALDGNRLSISMFRPVERNWMVNTASTIPETVPKPPVVLTPPRMAMSTDSRMNDEP